MNKLIRLSPTGIEYGDYAWNFASGCGNNIDGKCRGGGFNCWAYSITQRFGGHYPNGFKPTVYPEAFLSPLSLKKPSLILCAFMGDLFWDCPEFDPGYCGEPRGQFGEDEHGLFTLKGRIYDTIEKCPQHTFIFLTKQPQNLIKWSPFPDNCWVGITLTTPDPYALLALDEVEAKVRFMSVEPMLARFPEWDFSYMPVDSLIIGAQTKPTVYPKLEWVEEIVEAADRAGIPVFLKDNLWPLCNGSMGGVPKWAFNNEARFRQELPEHRLRQEMP